MFSIDHFVENNKNSVNDLVEKQQATKEMEDIRNAFERIEQDCAGSDQLKEYFETVKNYCYQYTDVVLQFNQLFEDNANGKITAEEYKSNYKNIDEMRSRIHNSTIDSFNILSRLMAKNGKNNDWIKPLAQGGRVAYGNFAIKKTVVDIIEFNKENNKNN